MPTKYDMLINYYCSHAAADVLIAEWRHAFVRVGGWERGSKIVAQLPGCTCEKTVLWRSRGSHKWVWLVLMRDMSFVSPRLCINNQNDIRISWTVSNWALSSLLLKCTIYTIIKFGFIFTTQDSGLDSSSMKVIEQHESSGWRIMSFPYSLCTGLQRTILPGSVTCCIQKDSDWLLGPFHVSPATEAHPAKGQKCITTESGNICTAAVNSLGNPHKRHNGAGLQLPPFWFPEDCANQASTRGVLLWPG